MGNCLHGGTWFGVGITQVLLGASHLGLACKLASCILYSLHLHYFASLCTSPFSFSLFVSWVLPLASPTPSSGFLSDTAGLFSSACHGFLILSHYSEGPALTLWDGVGLLLSWTFAAHRQVSEFKTPYIAPPHRAQFPCVRILIYSLVSLV